MPANKPSGQTLIETLAAIFILTMGVVAGVGLADYALGSSTSITKDVIGTGLAEEGVEIVKNMRDTNWLQAGPINTNCYDFSNPSANDGSCYKTWLTQNAYGSILTGYPGSTLNPPASPTSYTVAFWGSDLVSNQGSGATYWHSPYINWGLWTNSSSVANFICGGNGTAYGLPALSYGLNFNAAAATSTPTYGSGFYVPSCSYKSKVGSSGYYRKITLQIINTNPFNQSDSNNDLAELYVKSQVWWTDNKRCGPSADWPGPGKCSVEIDTYLTNWKTY
jgi:hypothetical protein